MRHFSTKKKALFTAFLFIFSIACFTLGLSAQEKLPKIKFEKYELPNGLDVILHVDRSIPVVSVNVWYHVGSKNEKKGRTGFAHLFEHLMFEGSEHIPNFDEPMERIGGTNNGSTSNDRTNYWENLPSNYLEMGIWLEADRMGYLLSVMDQKKLDTQRGVVQNEKRQGVDNQPYGRAYEIQLNMLYPPSHPYSWTVIGSLEDLGAATLEDVKDFFKSHYTPNNASLSIAGDFDPAVAKKLVEKYFASIPPGPPIEKLKKWMPTLDGVKRTVVTDEIELPRVYMAWHTPAAYAPGDSEFDILADALSSGKTSRLYKALVYEKEIAQDVSAYQASRELSSTFHITVTARKGHTLEEIEKVVDFELNKIFKEGITDDELMRAKVNIEASFIRRLERVGGFGGKADTLNQYNVYLGEPDGFQWDLDRYAKVTADSVLKCATHYLDLNKRVIVHFLPQGDLTSGQSEFDRTKEPAPLPEPSFSPPEIQSATLSNGLELFLVEDHKLPLLQVNLVLKSGWASDPSDRPGAAALTADLMDEGTQSRSALQISDEVKALGAFLSSGSSFDSSGVNLNVLKSKLDKGLELMTDIVLNPTFPEEELQRKKKIYLGQIQQESRQPFPSAIKLFLTTLFGEGHPYAQPYTGSGTAESINAIARKDLVNFYRANFAPNNAAVVIAGDITLSDAKSKIQKAFGSWKKKNVKKISLAEPKALQSTKIYILDKPGAAQSVLVLGNLGLKRNNPDFTAAQVVNNALGGMFTSRINSNLREEKAYTYGAGSLFMGTRGTGPFLSYTQVQTKFTKESIFEIVKELRDITGKRPLVGEELKASKNNLTKSFPQGFQTYGGIAGGIGSMVTYGLPLDQWKKYTAQVNAVDSNKSVQIAKKYIHPDALLIVVVGDRKVIEPRIRELGLGEIHFVERGDVR